MAKARAKKVKILPTISEDQIQKAVVRHLTLLGNPRCHWFHVPNGGSRNVAEASKLKAMGTRAGVADLVLTINGRTHFLELKTTKGKVSAAQKLEKVRAEAAGATYVVAHGLDAALDQLTQWGALMVRYQR